VIRAWRRFADHPNPTTGKKPASSTSDVCNVAIAAATATTPLERLIRVRYDYSDAGIAFRSALAEGSGTLELPIDRERFPYL
jgi:hypothetical protein